MAESCITAPTYNTTAVPSLPLIRTSFVYTGFYQNARRKTEHGSLMSLDNRFKSKSCICTFLLLVLQHTGVLGTDSLHSDFRGKQSKNCRLFTSALNFVSFPENCTK